MRLTIFVALTFHFSKNFSPNLMLLRGLRLRDGRALSCVVANSGQTHILTDHTQLIGWWIYENID